MGWASYQEDIISRSHHNRREVKHRLDSGHTKTPNSKDKATPMGTLKEFTVSAARPLPVIIMADVSGSMQSDGKINALNDAMKEMLSSFAAEEDAQAEIHVAVITFGGSVNWYQTLAPATTISWEPMRASGNTPLGGALREVTELVEDRERISGRAYRPTIVLLSDGHPNDEWESPLRDFLASERASKAQRFAMAIGEDADREMLQRFLDDPEARLFQAHEGREIRNFFRWVTMSVTSRSRSTSPNHTVDIDPLSLDDYGDF